MQADSSVNVNAKVVHPAFLQCNQRAWLRSPATYTVEDLTPNKTVIKAIVSPFLNAALLLLSRKCEPVVPA